MTRTTHFDTLDVRFDASTMVKQVDGTWLVDGEGAHVGTYRYNDDQGRPFIEHVPASTLFEQASMDSAGGGAVTIRHGPGMVTPERYREESHGAWVSAWQAPGEKLGVRLRLSSSDAIAFVSGAISRGESVELSPVYEVDVVEGQDDAEAAKYGQHHAVQKGRRYSAIAILGQDEARGGAGTALKLDSNSKAPQGCRTQVGGPRLDSAPRTTLQSATRRSQTMQYVTLTSGAKSCKITRGHLDGLARMRLDANSDAIETTEVTWQSEGEEPGLMVIPTMMWEGMLESIGASTAAPVEEEPVIEEQLEALDAGEPEDEKLDSKTVRRMIADALAADQRKRTVSDARTASVHSDAATILPPAYDYSVPWQQVALDAIAKIKPELVTEASKLSKDAKADPEKAGMLRQMLKSLRREPQTTSSTLVVNGDSNPASKPWLSPTPPETEQ